MKIGTMVQAVRKDQEWVVFTFADGQEFKIMFKDHVSGNSKLVSAVIKCPKDIRIRKEANDEIGNH